MTVRARTVSAGPGGQTHSPALAFFFFFFAANIASMACTGTHTLAVRREGTRPPARGDTAPHSVCKCSNPGLRPCAGARRTHSLLALGGRPSVDWLLYFCHGGSRNVSGRKVCGEFVL